MPKSADAFRTISEVADWLETPAHVLRFWESKFSQVKPVKRAGGRRYYRPTDMQLLGGIKRLLHDDGMTIKGVQKILREQGVKHVAALSQRLDEVTEIEASEMAHDVTPAAETPATVLSFTREQASPDVPETEDTDAFNAPGQDGFKADAEHQTEVASDTFDVSEETDKATAFKQAPAEDTQTDMPLAIPQPDADMLVEPAPPVMPSSITTGQAVAGPDAKPASPEVPEDPDDHVAGAPGVLSLLAAQDDALSAERIAALRDVAERLQSLRG